MNSAPEGPVPAVGSEPDRSSVSRPHLGRQMLACAGRTIGLLLRRQLHLHWDRIGTAVVLPGGRPYLVFRESTCDRSSDDDDEDDEADVTLVVWFQLKGITPSHPWRSWLFERESILNTLLYAGCPGFARKLWLVDRSTAGYAGVYTWHGSAAAERYARYITAILRPLSVEGTVGSSILGAGQHPAAPVLLDDRDEGPCRPAATGPTIPS